MPRSLALVVNPASGRRRGPDVAREVRPMLSAAGIEVEQIAGDSAQESVGLLREVLRSGVDGVAVVGGDGMIHLVAQEVAGTDVPLGVIPAGTGNDTARLLGLTSSDLQGAADALIAGKTRQIDLARAGERVVVTVVACGFDAKVNERANAMRRPSGQLRYTIATAVELGVFKPLDYELELDGVRTELSAMLVAVGNGPSYGGGLRMCEGASVDDGLLDVVVIGPVSKPELLWVYPKLFRGTHVSHRSYQRHRVRSVTLSSPGVVAYGDGERLGPLPLTVTAVPHALRVYTP